MSISSIKRLSKHKKATKLLQKSRDWIDLSLLGGRYYLFFFALLRVLFVLLLVGDFLGLMKFNLYLYSSLDQFGYPLLNSDLAEQWNAWQAINKKELRDSCIAWLDLIDTVDGPRAVTLENGQYVPAERLSAALRASFRLFRFGDLMMLFFVALFSRICWALQLFLSLQ